MKIIIYIYFIIIIFLNQISYGNPINISTGLQYDNNVYKEMSNGDADYSYYLGSNGDVNYKYKNNKIIFDQKLDLNKYYKASNQSRLNYLLNPNYEYEDNKNIYFNARYLYEQNGEESRNSTHDYISYKQRKSSTRTRFQSANGYELRFSGSMGDKTYSDPKLNYLDSKIKELEIASKYFIYPETSVLMGFEYYGYMFTNESTNYNISSEMNYIIYLGRFAWESRIIKDVEIGLNIFEKYYIFKNKETKYATNFNIITKNKISEALNIETMFKWETEYYRQSDATYKTDKEISFNMNFTFTPTVFGSSLVLYRISSYTKPNSRNEMTFYVNLEMNKNLMKYLALYCKGESNIVETDKNELNKYGETELNSYTDQKLLVGLKTTF